MRYNKGLITRKCNIAVLSVEREHVINFLNEDAGCHGTSVSRKLQLSLRAGHVHGMRAARVDAAVVLYARDALFAQ